MKGFFQTVIIVGSTLLTLGCGGNNVPSETISESTFDGDWPFTVSEGIVRCHPPTAITFEADGVIYSVNGTADGMAASEGWSDINPIWLDSNDPGPKVNIGDVIDYGQSLCE
ncbi:MAG: DUF2511 domain-containing protein [Cyanobacteria bacterium P01_H01_bin.153]